ncbi:DUF2934 domain-containing protein [Pelagibacterium montanilacus]|uniref:DUF2934 domain-containing protein n=1 Tax=Pelagibacterium montanilacus TaxID=2185280 RepID=UPI0019CFDB25|nr:DUF2934 domain-containing protein [Pelagibacterium montanilacus]
MNMSDEDIRRRAYELWEKEGKPEGRDLEHWLRASEDSGSADDGPQEDGSTEGPIGAAGDDPGKTGGENTLEGDEPDSTGTASPAASSPQRTRLDR